MSTPKTKYLYHGTCVANWESMRFQGYVFPAPSGDEHLSLTRNPSVARYFADIAVQVYEDFGKSEPIVLKVLRSDLDLLGFDPQPFESPVWEAIGESCAWEEEEAVLEAVPVQLFIPLEPLPDPFSRGKES